MGLTAVASPWRQLCGLDAYRITEIPRRANGETQSGPDADRDPGRAQRIAALVAAYHSGGTVAYGWMRLQAGGPVQILAAGAALAGSTGAGDVMLALPGGARGRALGRGALAPAMSGLACWRSIGGISDGLLVAAGEPQPDRVQAAPSLEDCLLPAWPGPFGWLVVAEPVPPAELEWLADETARGERLATGMADRFPDRDVEARRLRHRHTELRQGLSTGIWRVHLLAGGADPPAAARVAGLVCASADLKGLPYTLAPAHSSPAGLRDLLGRPGTETATGPQNSFHASTGLLAALTRSPDAEIPGIRLALRPDFDVTPETPAVAAQDAEPPVLAAAPTTGAASPAERPDARWHESTVPLGQVLDRQRMPAGPLRVPLGSLNRHVFVCGATGGGKSQTVRGLLEAATRAGVPWLVVEPAQSRIPPDGGAARGIRRPGGADPAR